MDLLTALVLGNYVFTALSFGYTWIVERQLKNHHEHRLRKVEKMLGVDGEDRDGE